MSNIYVERILQDVTMFDVLDMYYSAGKKNKKNGRTTCPFHNGNGLNFSYNNRLYQCFVCGKKGNVISFVRAFFNLEFKQAVSKINYDFNLNLPLNEILTNKDKQRMIEAQRIRRKEIEDLRKQIKLKDDGLWAIFDEWKRLDDNMRIYKPKSSGDVVHPLFIEAITKINYQSYLLDIAQAERRRDG